MLWCVLLVVDVGQMCVSSLWCCPSGRHREAQELCRSCGQPWRAASLRGPTGGWGPLPLGTTADEQDEQYQTQLNEAGIQPLQVRVAGKAAPGRVHAAPVRVCLQGRPEPLTLHYMHSHWPSTTCTCWHHGHHACTCVQRGRQG